MLLSSAIVVLGLVALFFGGDFLVTGAARLASRLGISALVIGLTVVAFGTSVPELLVAIDAASKGASGVALGNVIGSNIANIGLILGVSALILPLTIDWSLLRREVPYIIAASVVMLLLALDGTLSQVDGLLLVGGFIAFTVSSVYFAQREQREIALELADYTEAEDLHPRQSRSTVLEVGRMLGGIVLLALGAQWTVDGAVGIARGLGISEFIIGVTVVAFGTSLPELVAGVMGALRKQNDIVVGNVIGSNLANLLAILGLTALLHPIPIAPELLQFDVLIMIAFALALLPFLLRNVMTRPIGALFLAAYLLYVIVTVIREGVF